MLALISFVGKLKHFDYQELHIKHLFTGSEFVENAPLETCAKLVIDSKRERREKEQREKDKLEEEEAAKMKKELSEFQYDDDDENEGIKAELARTRERLSSCKSLEEGSKMSTTTN